MGACASAASRGSDNPSGLTRAIVGLAARNVRVRSLLYTGSRAGAGGNAGCVVVIVHAVVDEHVRHSCARWECSGSTVPTSRVEWVIIHIIVNCRRRLPAVLTAPRPVDEWVARWINFVHAHPTGQWTQSNPRAETFELAESRIRGSGSRKTVRVRNQVRWRRFHPHAAPLLRELCLEIERRILHAGVCTSSPPVSPFLCSTEKEPEVQRQPDGSDSCQRQACAERNRKRFCAFCTRRGYTIADSVTASGAGMSEVWHAGCTAAGVAPENVRHGIEDQVCSWFGIEQHACDERVFFVFKPCHRPSRLCLLCLNQANAWFVDVLVVCEIEHDSCLVI